MLAEMSCLRLVVKLAMLFNILFFLKASSLCSRVILLLFLWTGGIDNCSRVGG
ncbi:hypothetical protein CC77DRAFT_854894 [Alternaria alternata]|uniref:Uncharacterized protein n=1 Tax=Alternaria alternata TaxID=5599 RepID=A0A177DN74_ALTAL|nr:hypothetical protein CC77DRAFT_854894 [Alternaria alternata]OAG21185.1 hypothetical protein CC77DRAFT_854894 [Alternaria alternata]